MDKREFVIGRYFAICDGCCRGCEFEPLTEGKPTPDCHSIAMFRSEEAGAEIGFEPWKEKVKLPTKPIKELTLGELKNYCEMVQAENKKCSVCAIKGDFGVCPFDGVKPPMWNFDGPPKFTQEERVAAKVIRDMFPAVISVYREKKTNELVLLDRFHNSWVINGNMFPTIKVGMSALIDEIIGDGVS